MSTTTIILAQLEVEHCTAELFLNGVPLTRIAAVTMGETPKPPAQPVRIPIENVAAEAFLVPGTNRLDVLVEPGSRPSTARTEYHEQDFRPMRAVGRLIRFPEGVPGLVEHGELLGEARFAWEDARPARRAFPLEVGTQIELFGAHGRWSWQDADVLVPGAALVAEAAALLDDVERAIRRGDADRLWALTQVKHDDLVRALPAVTEGDLRNNLEILLAHAITAPDPVMARDPERFDFRLVAGDRMLELVDDDYTTSFKLRDPEDGSAVPYHILVARLDGQLRIVR